MSQALRDRDVLDAVGTSAAALSLAGSSFIVLCYLLFRELRKFSFKLVYFLAVSVSGSDLELLGFGGFWVREASLVICVTALGCDLELGSAKWGSEGSAVFISPPIEKYWGFTPSV